MQQKLLLSSIGLLLLVSFVAYTQQQSDSDVPIAVTISDSQAGNADDGSSNAEGGTNQSGNQQSADSSNSINSATGQPSTGSIGSTAAPQSGTLDSSVGGQQSSIGANNATTQGDDQNQNQNGKNRDKSRDSRKRYGLKAPKRDGDQTSKGESMALWIEKRRGRRRGRGSRKGAAGSQRGSKKSRSYTQVQYPVQHFSDMREFPSDRYSPLIAVSPWQSIFYDKTTLQTFIYSPTGGMYIMPPVANAYGQRFAVAQLVQWGYVTLGTPGAALPPNFNVAPLVNPTPADGASTGTESSAAASPAPVFNGAKGTFDGAVGTDLPSIKPRYPQWLAEDGSVIQGAGGSAIQGGGGSATQGEGGSVNQGSKPSYPKTLDAGGAISGTNTDYD